MSLFKYCGQFGCIHVPVAVNIWTVQSLQRNKSKSTADSYSHTLQNFAIFGHTPQVHHFPLLLFFLWAPMPKYFVLHVRLIYVYCHSGMQTWKRTPSPTASNSTPATLPTPLEFQFMNPPPQISQQSLVPLIGDFGIWSLFNVMPPGLFWQMVSTPEHVCHILVKVLWQSAWFAVLKSL